MNLRVSRNTGDGAKWHIIKESGESVCGVFNVEDGRDEKSFRGLDRKPALGTWCGVCERIFREHYREEESSNE